MNREGDTISWLGTWAKRVKLTVDSGDIDASLIHFPVGVFLSSSCGRNNEDLTEIFDDLGANSLKIAFTKDDGTTQLYAEIDEWDNSGETAVLHVSKSGWNIASDSDTDFYLYFDNNQANNTTYIGIAESTPGEAVWNANYKMRLSMKDFTTSVVRDSTSNGSDGAKKGANEPIEATGKIYKGQDFDGSDDYINIGEAGLDFTPDTDEFTVESWVKTSDTERAFITKSNVAEIDQYTMYIDGSGNLVLYSGDVRINTGVTINNDAWRHVVLRNYDDSGTKKFRGYIDGVEDDTIGVSGNANVAFNVYMGVWWDFSYFDGTLDEVRISDTARSAAWIKASYETQRDELLDFSAVELNPNGVRYASWVKQKIFTGTVASGDSHRTAGNWESETQTMTSGQRLLNTTITHSGLSGTEYIDKIEWLVDSVVQATYATNINTGSSTTITEDYLTDGTFWDVDDDFTIKIYLVGDGTASPAITEISGDYENIVRDYEGFRVFVDPTSEWIGHEMEITEDIINDTFGLETAMKKSDVVTFTLVNKDGKYMDSDLSTFFEKECECKVFFYDIVLYGKIKTKKSMASAGGRLLDIMFKTFGCLFDERIHQIRLIQDGVKITSYEDAFYYFLEKTGLDYFFTFRSNSDVDYVPHNPSTYDYVTPLPSGLILTYDKKYGREIIDDLCSRSNYTWYIYGDIPTGKKAYIYFERKAIKTDTADYTYDLKVDIKKNDLENREDEIINRIYFTGTDIVEQDIYSIREFGVKAQRFDSKGIEDPLLLIDIAQRILADYKDYRMHGNVHVEPADTAIFATKKKLLVQILDDGIDDENTGFTGNYRVIATKFRLGTPYEMVLTLDNRWINTPLENYFNIHNEGSEEDKDMTILHAETVKLKTKSYVEAQSRTSPGETAQYGKYDITYIGHSKYK